MEWLTENWDKVALILTSIVTIASVLANFTKTDVDDKVVGFVGKLIALLAVNIKSPSLKK